MDEEDLTASEWVTIEQLAEFLGLSVHSTRNWCAKHKIRRYNVARVDDVLAAKAAIRPVGRPRKVS